VQIRSSWLEQYVADDKDFLETMKDQAVKYCRKHVQSINAE